MINVITIITIDIIIIIIVIISSSNNRCRWATRSPPGAITTLHISVEPAAVVW